MNYISLIGPCNYLLEDSKDDFTSLNIDYIRVLCDTRLGPVVIQFPEVPPTKMNFSVMVEDQYGTAGTNVITCLMAAWQYCNQNYNQYVLNSNYQKVSFRRASETGWLAHTGSYIRKYNIALQGIINGINATFTSPSPFIPESLVVYRNGLRQKIINDFQTTGTSTVIFNTSPIVGEILTIDY